MLTCKQVSRSLENIDYAKLNPFSRMMLRLHVALCAVCGKYNKQRMVMHDAVRGYLEHEEQTAESSDEGLDSASRDRMRASLHDALK